MQFPGVLHEKLGMQIDANTVLLFFFSLLCFVRKGPPKSTAHIEKACNGNANRI